RHPREQHVAAPVVAEVADDDCPYRHAAEQMAPWQRWQRWRMLDLRCLEIAVDTLVPEPPPDHASRAERIERGGAARRDDDGWCRERCEYAAERNCGEHDADSTRAFAGRQ